MRERIGEGRTAEVFVFDDEKVLKLYRPGFEHLAEIEVEAASTPVHIGAAAPMVYGIFEENGRRGILYARVQGESMLHLMERNPMAIRRMAHLLASVQADLHARPVPPLRTVRERLSHEIQHVEVDDAVRDAALSVLETLPDGDRLCHFDLHPDNVLVDGDKATIIDWMNASRGDPCADVCRTCIILSCHAEPPDMTQMLRDAIVRFNESFQRQYLAEYFRVTGRNMADVEKWTLPVAVARLREQVPGEREDLLLMIEKCMKSG